MALIEVLVNVFGRTHIEGELRINVTFETQYQLSYIWDNPSVVQQMASDIMLPFIIPAMVFRIAILPQGGLLRKVLWIVLTALAMDHARSIWIQWPTDTMSHIITDQLVQMWVGDWIWKLSRDYRIYFCRGPYLVLLLQPYKKVDVWETSLLELNCVNASDSAPKDLLLDNEIKQKELLLVKDT